MKKQFIILLAAVSLLAIAQSPQRFPGGVIGKYFQKTGSSADSVLLGNGQAKAISSIKTDTVFLSNRINSKLAIADTTHKWLPITTKYVKSVNLTSGDIVIDKNTVGLSNVDNTSDANKPVSTATQTALNGKANTTGSNATGTWPISISGWSNTATYWSGAGTYNNAWGNNNLGSIMGLSTGYGWTAYDAAHVNAWLGISGTNTGDETLTSIKTKLGVATTSNDGYITYTDWITFNNKQAAYPNLTGIGGLANSAGFLKNNGSGTFSYDNSTYLTGNQNITLSGDVTGSGTTAITTTLANSGVTAGTYKSVTVDAKGRVTAGTNPTTLSGYGITDGTKTDGSNASGTWGINISGTAANATNWGGKQANFDVNGTALFWLAGLNSDGLIKPFYPNVIKSWLGLGSNAYSSTAYLPLTSGALSGNLTAPSITLTSGAGTNKILTSDASGNASWGNVINSGTYTPTYSTILGCSSVTTTSAIYTRTGNVYDIDIAGTLTETNGYASCSFYVTLPGGENASVVSGICSLGGSGSQTSGSVVKGTNNQPQPILDITYETGAVNFSIHFKAVIQ